MLTIRNLKKSHGGRVLFEDAAMQVNYGERVALVGPNGAGKSTLLGTVAGWFAPRSGTVLLDGRDLTGLGAETVVRAGIGLVPERRQMFGELSVERNLELGAYIHGGAGKDELERVLTLFPRLRERRAQRAGTLSGGEQQMVAIARGLLANPRVLLLDEPSLGLAPIIVKRIFEILRTINREDGVTIVIAEQDAAAALALADTAYVLEVGRVAISGPSADLAGNEQLRKSYLGY